ncbi:helix-turn-helix transcriptional regulator [Sulfitobacter sp. SK011]|uniref:helix-turn-helix transcriptional regulator n=1 Tax=Sulfitobacter sp. SK011 TaxID=1389004 RepID=UPI000E0B0722|nr:helix-turn-helix transcriptional regulator [Sulfitobacter sp. SK011]AXI43422.1 hypothetical protein C1J02_16880 [Sulfitobacter sp. SK011]
MSTRLLRNQIDSKSFSIIADWAYALNENGEITDVLGRIAMLVHAEAVMIVRISNVEQRSRIVGHFGMQTGKIWPPTPRTFAGLVIGAFINTAKVGSIWKLTESNPFEFAGTSADAVDIPAGIAEVIASPLESVRGHIDLIEFHFKHRPAEHNLNLLIMLLGTLAVAWGRRTPALVAKKLSQSQRASISRVTDDSRCTILDCDNPARLSRSEFRVCSLLKEGMTVSVISESLSVRPATVRSHLSSVFSKTGMSGQVELLHELNRTPKRTMN